MSEPLGRDLPTPLHIIHNHQLMCLAGVHDGEPVYLLHGTPDDHCATE